MKKLLTILALVLMSCAASPSYAVVAKIGLSAPLTGPLSQYGTGVRDGATLAVEEINKAGGLTINGQKITLTLDVFDDQFSATSAVVGANKLIDDGVVAAVANVGANLCIATAPTYYRARIAQISPSCSSPKFTQLGFDTTFRGIGTDTYQGEVLAHFAKQLGAVAVATVDDGAAFGTGLVDRFTQVAPSVGVKVVSHDTVAGIDYRAVITHIKGEHPDAIMFGGAYDTAAPFIKQAYELGITSKILVGDGACTNITAKLASSKAAALVYCTNADMNRNGFRAKEFINHYKARFGVDDFSLYAPYAYDAVYTFAAAMKLANSIQPEAIARALHSVKYEGITGEKSYAANGDLLRQFFTKYRFVDGALVVL